MALTGLKIRTFHVSDEPAVSTLWREVFGYAAAHNDPAMIIQRKLAYQRELFYVAEMDGAIAGTVMCGYDGHRGWIYSLAVDPRFRLRGIGRQLARHAESALTDLGCLKINLQIVAGNAGVTQFYERLGFRIEERISMGKIL